jgi:serine/threonine protein kinase
LDREVGVWKHLNHPNIAKFYGISFQLGGRPALVMQWYEHGAATGFLTSQSDEKRLEIVRAAYQAPGLF